MMRKLICFLILSLSCHAHSLPKNYDLNNYFEDRQWQVNLKGVGIIDVQSTYHGEPVQRPNRMNVFIKCLKNEKLFSLIQDFPICGIDSVSAVQNKLIFFMSEYNPNDRYAYCNIRRKEIVQIPDVCSRNRQPSSVKKKK